MHSNIALYYFIGCCAGVVEWCLEEAQNRACVYLQTFACFVHFVVVACISCVGPVCDTQQVECTSKQWYFRCRRTYCWRIVCGFLFVAKRSSRHDPNDAIYRMKILIKPSLAEPVIEAVIQAFFFFFVFFHDGAVSLFLYSQPPPAPPHRLSTPTPSPSLPPPQMYNGTVTKCNNDGPRQNNAGS